MATVAVNSEVKTKDGRKWRVVNITSGRICTLKSLDPDNPECVKTLSESELLTVC